MLPPRATPPPDSGRATPAATLRWGLWFALAAGLGEAALVTAHGRVIQGFIHLSPQLVWMAPVADVLWFALPVLFLALLAGRRRGVAVPLSLGVPAFLFWLSLLLLFSRLYHWAAVLLALGLAVQSARWLAPRRAGFDRFTRRTLPVQVGLVLVLAAGALLWPRWREGRLVARLGPAPAGARNVVLIVWDTVRRANLSLYGYPRPTTPNLTRWSRQGVVFQHALATTSWTLPSHASMFTGRLPDEMTAGWLTPLDDRWPTLAGYLARHGYRTAGFVANALYLNAGFGTARGFQRYEVYPVNWGELIINSSIGRALAASGRVRRVVGYYDILGRKSAAQITDAFLRWVPEHPTRPFFAFLNYLDAHQPYLPPRPWNRKFASDTPRDFSLLDHRPHMGNLKKAIDRMSPAQVQREMEAYDAGIAYLDDQLGRLLAELQRRGVLQHTLVIITSDHGEQFLEHGLFEHGNSLYRQATEVPLVVLDGAAIPHGGEVADPVSLQHLPATVADLVGLEPAPFPGPSLREFWSDTAAQAPPVITQLTLPGGKQHLRSVVALGYHAIWEPDSTLLYDFARDPAELQNLAGSPSGEAVLARLRDLLPREP